MSPRSDLLAATEEFHRACGHPVPEVPTVPGDARLALRLSLLLEEVVETFEAAGLSAEHVATAALMRSQSYSPEMISTFILDKLGASDRPVNLPRLVDGFHDTIVIAHGGALESAGEAASRTAWEVGRANLDKIGPDGTVLRRSDGKTLKPEGWLEPQIEEVLRAHGWTPEA